MRILHVNNTDLPGARFNGYSMLNKQRETGVDAFQIVRDKVSHNDKVVSFELDRELYNSIFLFEKHLSIKNMCFPYGKILAETKTFKDADVVHYHLIHNDLISIFDLKHLFSLKPSVWTIHDPWVLTGHCIYPINCKKYLSGCYNCPDLGRNFAIQENNAPILWKIKDKVFRELRKPKIIVSTQWMRQLIEESPFGKYFQNLEVIPFGVNGDIFKKITVSEKKALRRKLSLKDQFTIFFRQDASYYKGLDFINEALSRLKTKIKANILTVGTKGLLKQEIYENYEVREYDWIHDESFLANLYQVSDIFLMPSRAETFGLMAIESMLSGAPVICKTGTALPEVTNGDVSELVFETQEEFAALILDCYTNHSRLEKLSYDLFLWSKGRYIEKLYHDRLVRVYLDEFERFHS